MTSMKIYCCGCGCDVAAALTNGAKIYPNRRDLAGLPFWQCGTCKGFVGCHHKTQDRTRPLGCIPTPEIRELRKRIHALIDPLWHDGLIDRRKLYALLSSAVGREYHTAELRTISDAKAVLDAARLIADQISSEATARILAQMRASA